MFCVDKRGNSMHHGAGWWWKNLCNFCCLLLCVTSSSCFSTAPLPCLLPNMKLAVCAHRLRLRCCSANRNVDGVEDNGLATFSGKGRRENSGSRRRKVREDRTPRLCQKLREGGCYNKMCTAYHGRRYYDAKLGLWRTRRMFRQSTARPSHEQVSLQDRSHTSGTETHGNDRREEQFVLKSADTAPTCDAVQSSQHSTAGSSHQPPTVSGRAGSAENTSVPSGFREQESSNTSRAEKNTMNKGGWRAMCKRCQRPCRVCICSSLPVEPMAIKTRLIILQHPKERKKATYGTVPIIRLCIKDVHLVTARNLNGPTEAHVKGGGGGEGAGEAQGGMHQVGMATASQGGGSSGLLLPSCASSETKERKELCMDPKLNSHLNPKLKERREVCMDVSVDAGKRHQQKKHDHEMKRCAALCEAFGRDEVLQAALAREDTMLLFPDLDPYDPFRLEMPEAFKRPAVNLEDLFAIQPPARVHPAEEEEGAAGARGAREHDAIGLGRTSDAVGVGRTLIAIDGTWAQAKAIYKHTPSLHRATRVQFSKHATIKGKYTFRKEPKDNFLSTLESVAYSLSVLEGQGGRQEEQGAEESNGGGKGAHACKTPCEWLMKAFKHMVDNQVAFTPQRRHKTLQEEEAAL